MTIPRKRGDLSRYEAGLYDTRARIGRAQPPRKCTTHAEGALLFFSFRHFHRKDFCGRHECLAQHALKSYSPAWHGDFATYADDEPRNWRMPLCG